MPADFERCVREGAKVYTQTLPNGKYRHYCVDPKTGKRVHGEIKTKKKESK